MVPGSQDCFMLTWDEVGWGSWVSRSKAAEGVSKEAVVLETSGNSLRELRRQVPRRKKK